MAKMQRNTDVITRRAPRWAWHTVDELLDVVIDSSVKDNEPDLQREAENAKDVLETVSEYPLDETWEDDSIQFPRLIAEIAATQEVDFHDLAETMDLTVRQVRSLFDRADSTWERIKGNAEPAAPQGVVDLLQAARDVVAASDSEGCADDMTTTTRAAMDRLLTVLHRIEMER